MDEMWRLVETPAEFRLKPINIPYSILQSNCISSLLGTEYDEFICVEGAESESYQIVCSHHKTHLMCYNTCLWL